MRLQESLITYISWRTWCLVLIFCMLTDIHERKELSVWLWVGHAQACPDMPTLPNFALGGSGLYEWCSEPGSDLKWKIKSFPIMLCSWKILVCLKSGQKCANWSKDRHFHCFLGKSSLNFSDFLYEVRGLWKLKMT